ncbi:predicted protein [Naegleria gruberi]|uniref:Predicted protein n=1 Tax=Naegleria gruberi TaxID=5762 RepID=D2VYF8_NAEGR|nr:uncharacterized protein NAEGRDRAFT_53252 [Naegleria gruberi]EFC38051.1 predicted protein [Naegleria gruberi]|eukprot:XP_002670795.1 predicted protein [Naegleria gruberi strain NEG-M]
MIHTTPSSGTSETSHYLLPNQGNENNRIFSSPSSLEYSLSSLGSHSPQFYHSPPTSPESLNLMENHNENHRLVQDQHEDLKYLDDNSGQHQYSMETGQSSITTENHHNNCDSYEVSLNIDDGHMNGHETDEFRVDTGIRSVLRRFSWLTLGSSSSTTPRSRHSIGLPTTNNLFSPPITETRKFSIGQKQHPNTAFVLMSPQSPRTTTPSPTTSSSSMAHELEQQNHESVETPVSSLVDQDIAQSGDVTPVQSNNYRANTYSPPPFTRTISVVLNDITNSPVGVERRRRDSIASNKKVNERANSIAYRTSNITNLINNTSFHSTKKQLEKEKKRRGESCSKFCHSFFTISNILMGIFILQAIVCLIFGISIMRAGGAILDVKIREYQFLQIRAFVEERISSFTSKYTTMTNHMMEGLKGIPINDNVALLRFFDYVAITFGTDTSLNRMEFYRMDDSFSMLRDFNNGKSVISINSISNPSMFSTYLWPKTLTFVENPNGYYASSSDTSYSIYKNYMYGPILELNEIFNNSAVLNNFILNNQEVFCKSLSSNIPSNYNNFKWVPSKSIQNSSIFLHYPVYISNNYNHTIVSPNTRKMFIVNSDQNLENSYLFGVFSLHFSIDRFTTLLNVQNERFYLQSEYSSNTSFIMNTWGDILATRGDGNESLHNIQLIYKTIMKHGLKKNCEVESEVIDIPNTRLTARLSYTCDGHGLNLVLVVEMDNSDSFIPLLLANNSILSFVASFLLIIVSIIVMIAVLRALNTSMERMSKKLHRITRLKQRESEGGKSFSQIISDFFPNTSMTVFYEVREIENLIMLLGQGMDALKKFLPEPFVKEIILSKPLPFNVATKKHLTILFCELAGCDKMADTIDIPLFLEMITEYSSIMCKIIQDHKGMIDRFDGGTAMCLFSFQDNTLIPTEQNQEVNACHAAMDIIYMMEDFKTKWQKRTGHPIHIEIGINSGEIYYGNFNCTDSRSSYSVLGASLDIASTLQRFNFSYSTQVLIGEETFLKVKDIFVCYFVDLVRFSGYKKRRGMKIYSLECPVRESTDLERKIALDLEQVQQKIMEKSYASALSLCGQVMLFNDRPQVSYLHNRLSHAKEESEKVIPNDNDLFSTVANFGIDPEEILSFL